MKKFFFIMLAAMVLFCSCAEKKEFKRKDGSTFTAKPYGWMNTGSRIEGVEYDVSACNVVWCVVLSESVVAPLLITGLELFEPVSYTEPEKKVSGCE